MLVYCFDGEPMTRNSYVDAYTSRDALRAWGPDILTWLHDQGYVVVAYELPPIDIKFQGRRGHVRCTLHRAKRIRTFSIKNDLIDAPSVDSLEKMWEYHRGDCE